MESTIPELTESVIVISIAALSIIIAIIKYVKTQAPDIEHDARRVVSAIKDHEEETVRVLGKINSSLQEIKDVLER